MALFLQAPLATVQSLAALGTKSDVLEQTQTTPLPQEQRQRPQATYDNYVLGPGDGLQIELLDLPELSGRFSIGPDGSPLLPRLRALVVEGLTLDELRNLLVQKFSTDVRNPQFYVSPVV